MSTAVQSVIIYALYLFTAVFFSFITRKLFFEKKKTVQTVLAFFLSPAVSNIISNVTYLNFFNDLTKYDRDAIISFSFFFTTLQVIMYGFFMYLYVKLVKPRNRSIAIFTYVCSIMLVPSFFFMNAMFNPIPLVAAYLALSAAFYVMTVRPLSELTLEKQKTDVRIFVVLPIIVFIFNTVIHVLYMYYEGLSDNSFFAITKMAEGLSGSSPVIGYFKMIVLNERDYLDAMLIAVLVADVFILTVLMIAFWVITKNIKYMNETIAAHKQIKTLSVEVMEALAHTIDAKDKYTRGHSVRVAKYSRMIAERMGLPEEDLDNAYYYGLLHDIGKIAVPNDIINSPSKLTEDEYSVIKVHPVVGNDILGEIKSRPDLAIGARYHHERFDGTGYPEGKAGEEIPLLARIISVADSYDAMTSNRSYRDYLPQEKVKKELVENKGTQFDPNIVDYMIQIIDEDRNYTLHE
ncbi:MAG: HD-GYP domain-containing protein [Lachnospiraceae bacterium]|nr:HD-GYP domain-containing protein [Lachnospiraceae bacterium]